MSLRDDIAAHARGILSDLEAAHDYYANSKGAWRFVQRHMEAGCKVRVRNAMTGNVTTELDLPETSQHYVEVYLASATRDVVVHNRGIASLTYEEKAGPLARANAGEMLEIPEPHHRDCWQFLRKIVHDISTAAVAKAGA